MSVIGLNVHSGQTAAALSVDGVITAAVAEERFDRIKRSRAFPRRAVEYCLSEAGCAGLDGLDAVAVSWNPGRNMEQINASGFTSWRRYDPEWLYIIPNQLLSMTAGKGLVGDHARLRLGDDGPDLLFVDHHRAHMAHAAFQSPFEHAAVAVIDEYGELASVTLGRFRGNRLEVLRRIDYPHSLGVFYSAMTEFLGFSPNSDEWKVMGAAAFGDPSHYRQRVESLFPWDEARQEWWLDQRYVEHANMKRGGYGNDALARVLGMAPRRPDEPLLECHFDLAASAQAVFETRMMQILRALARETGETALVASGGCFMNSLANGRILAETPFQQLFIPCAAADNGTAMGAALYAQYVVHGRPWEPPASPPSAFLGPAISEGEVRNVLDGCKLDYIRVDDPAAAAAGLIASGKVVGWVQGRMEFGERALGGRSILADPRDPDMGRRINAAVKFREGFRPFAPSVLQERVGDYFDLLPGVKVPYMEQVYPILPARRAEIPAVTHADGTGRLQTVSAEHAPLFYRLIGEFQKLTGVPVVLNTSFNVQGEPVVCSARDALRTYHSSGLDALVISNFVLDKSGLGSAAGVGGTGHG